ncbi:MAG: hypothetical protein U0T36_03250 [Saprospiraceae bacterium]
MPKDPTLWSSMLPYTALKVAISLYFAIDDKSPISPACHISSTPCTWVVTSSP